MKQQSKERIHRKLKIYQYRSKKEARENMKLYDANQRLFSMGLFAAVLLIGLHLFALPAVAGCPGVAGADTDGDGILDVEECGGFTLPGPAGGTYTTNPDVPDLFVIMISPDSGSLLPENPYELVEKPMADGGLGITIHQITADQADSYRRIISRSGSFQKAIRIYESLDTGGTILGSTEGRTPNDTGDSIIYTARIVREVETVCSDTPACSDDAGNSGLGLADLKNIYMKHTLAHEIGHKLSLTTVDTSRFGGFHDKAGTGFLMDQSLIYKEDRKTGAITYYMTKDFAAEHQDAMVLK